MRKLRRLWPVLAAATAALTAACGSPQGNTPPTQVTPPSAASTTSTTATTPSVTRPRALTMAGVDPCKLISPAALPALKIDRPGKPSQDPNFQNAPRCNYIVTGMSYFLTSISTNGVDVWSGGRSTVTPVAPISGFPAVRVVLPSDTNRCDVAVDVADNQQLLATATVSPSFKDEFPAPCDAAQQVAQAAMSTLLQQR